VEGVLRNQTLHTAANNDSPEMLIADHAHAPASKLVM
jgi:hypothetical protein